MSVLKPCSRRRRLCRRRFVAVNADLVTTFQQTVAATAGVVAEATGTTVTISWSAVSNATGYKIERNTNYVGIKAAHVVELRKAVNALRAISGLTAVYSGNDVLDTAVQDDPIDDAHFTSLLTELNTARQAAGLGTVAFGTAPAAHGAIRGAQLEELRDGVR